ncbi:hypothetical protein THOM_2747 [Trachipleistophora hominis]|uniref:Uncharacterized protein n=1 Tax=Trachipleistophora hominis TaxID=72359 RepID=L7JSD3_TRAHO|nr:hypothetical protein THOM_2747 [Trachipleistophora hominis]
MSVVHDRPESGAWPLTTSGVTFGLSPGSSETPAGVPGQVRKAQEGRVKNRSVMPLDGLGCTRTTVVAEMAEVA